jgi:hypothetical protein
VATMCKLLPETMHVKPISNSKKVEEEKVSTYRVNFYIDERVGIY